jgi:putative N-acetylmannosamine-6-phosphate epimerase
MLEGIVVSCQARPDNPLHGPMFMSAMAVSAVQGGATAIRANGVKDIKSIKANVKVPIIGINKIYSDKSEVYITPSKKSALDVASAGASIIGIDASIRQRIFEPLSEIMKYIKNDLKCLILADVSNLDEALQAEKLGADFIATTLSGYTTTSPKTKNEPDLDLVAALVNNCKRPIIAEGRYENSQQISSAFELGAAAVVVGTAITNPREITRKLVKQVKDL